jgi:hypothetical protein
VSNITPGRRPAASRAAALLLALGTAACGGVRPYYDINARADPIRSVAVLPFPDQGLTQVDYRDIDTHLSTRLGLRLKDMRVMPAPQGVSRVREAGDWEAWRTYQAGPLSVGALDTALVVEVGAALGTDVFMTGELLDIFRQDGEQLTGRGAAQFGAPAPGESRVEVQLYLFDCDSGRLIWRHSGTGKLVSSSRDPAPPIADTVAKAIDELLKDLFGDRD